MAVAAAGSSRVSPPMASLAALLCLCTFANYSPPSAAADLGRGASMGRFPPSSRELAGGIGGVLPSTPAPQSATRPTEASPPPSSAASGSSPGPWSVAPAALPGGIEQVWAQPGCPPVDARSNAEGSPHGGHSTMPGCFKNPAESVRLSSRPTIPHGGDTAALLHGIEQMRKVFLALTAAVGWILLLALVVYLPLEANEETTGGAPAISATCYREAHAAAHHHDRPEVAPVGRPTRFPGRAVAASHSWGGPPRSRMLTAALLVFTVMYAVTAVGMAGAQPGCSPADTRSQVEGSPHGEHSTMTGRIKNPAEAVLLGASPATPLRHRGDTADRIEQMPKVLLALAAVVGWLVSLALGVYLSVEANETPRGAPATCHREAPGGAHHHDQSAAAWAVQPTGIPRGAAADSCSRGGPPRSRVWAAALLIFAVVYAVTAMGTAGVFIG